MERHWQFDSLNDCFGGGQMVKIHEWHSLGAHLPDKGFDAGVQWNTFRWTCLEHTLTSDCDDVLANGIQINAQWATSSTYSCLHILTNKQLPWWASINSFTVV